MKIVAFHSHQLSLRGSEIALYDYAKYNEEILGNQSCIIAPAGADAAAESKFRDRFPDRVFLYEDFWEDTEYWLSRFNWDVMYHIRYGLNHPEYGADKLAPSCKNVVHAVFQANEPHGDVYAYVSEWLSKVMSNGQLPFVPHMIDLPNIPEANMREELNIPKDAIVFGRYGGNDSFDIPWAWQAVRSAAIKDKNKYFLFMNTDKFVKDDIPNIIFLPGTSSNINKVKFINTCDAMLHARLRGESFGLAIGEFSSKNKPVISWKGGLDRAHIHMLGDKGIWYRDSWDLDAILRDFKPDPSKNWDAYTQKFNPTVVMNKFNEVFLNVD